MRGGAEPPLLKRLMLIDDCEIDHLIYARIIARSGLVGVLVHFTSAVQALDDLSSLRTPMPDLILLDVNMPDMSGFDFLASAGERMSGKVLPPVVMLSASRAPRDTDRIRACGLVSSFLTKPLSRAHLEKLACRYGNVPAKSRMPL